jgi:hypothetical protein
MWIKNVIRKWTQYTNAVTSTSKKAFKLFGYICVVFLYNPTGFSYYHLIKDYPWKENLSNSGFMAAFGLALFGFSMFMVSSAWKMLEILGKVIVFPILGALSVGIAYSDMFNQSNTDDWTMLALANVVVFVLFGAIYPRIKWLFFRTRQTDDSDTSNED